VKKYAAPNGSEDGAGRQPGEGEIRRSPVVFRITAWYTWLFTVLLLTFGTYTYKCLDWCLSSGVIDALSVRAKQISRRYASQTPLRDASSPVPATDLERRVNEGKPLIGTATLTIGKRKYVVRVGASKRPIKDVLYGTLLTLLVALVVGLALAAFGSFCIIHRSLGPVYATGLTAPNITGIAVGDEADQRSSDVAQNLSTRSQAEPSQFSLDGSWRGALNDELEDASKTPERPQW